jgi:hypothetical protein
LAKISQTGAVWFSYTQWLWRVLQISNISISGLDAAFNIEKSPLALFNPEIFTKVRVGWMLALIAW